MLKIDKPACLLIHGFTSSPREMNNLGDFLRSKGHAVRVPTLPGHDTQPSELFKIKSGDWLHAVEQAYQELATAGSPIVVIGESMGAALALHVAANFPVSGVVALAPALRLSLWRKVAVHTLSSIIRWQTKRKGPDVRDKSLVHQLQSYDSFPTASVKELLKTMRHVRDELHRVTAPLLIMHGKHDQTMSKTNVEVLCREVGSKEIKTVFLENSSHILTLDYDHKEVFETVLSFIEERSRETKQDFHVS
jgi:carboxylesterase